MQLNPKYLLTLSLLCLTALLTCCSSGSGQNTLAAHRDNATQAFKDTGNYAVYFINESDFAQAGFVRQPLFAGAFEPNLFVSNKKGNNTLRVSLDSETELFYSGDSHVKYYLQAGDTLYLHNNPQQQQRAPYVLESRHAARNAVIGFYQQARQERLPLLYAEMSNQLNGFIDKKKMNNFAALQAVYTQSLAFADTYFSKHKPEAGFDDFIKNDLRFDHYCKVFSYAPEKQIDSLVRHHYFSFDADAGSLFFKAESAYQGALYSYLMYTLRKKNGTADPALSLVLHTADSLYAPEAAALIKFIYLRNNINRLYPAQDKELRQAITALGQRPFARILSDKIAQIGYSSVNANKVVAPDGQTYTLDHIIKANTGKVLYLDLWASWCVPCQQAFAQYPSLFAAVDTSKVRFVLLSIDQSKEAWIKAVARNKLPSHVQHYLLVNPDKAVLKSMDALTIPRYKIYDKTGRISNNDAPGPGDQELPALLKDLIKK
ncbi:TlpA family protein disulfide reductase [Taibaiella chishuiensis]|uniref:Thiol-disulfide isomerase/thioredoxin n=1 Tax=Taibaiella chishuiensis TaxID=1434707 RepID=A0A2P8DAS7_9BACT|nr:TlpA disulfide reductase family protein [Taibaiella chishuiensis]PSK94287.1 thiol-disulfide isomerase/thioredoxin [Taibaiella chishuiensis]